MVCLVLEFVGPWVELGFGVGMKTKEARIYNGVKTISLTSGAGKTVQPLVKG